MGRRSQNHQHSAARSHTLPSSPTHSISSSSSSSSSDFEFTISLSPHKSAAALCPADELFYKGQLLPLQLSPRLSMVRTLLLSSPSSSDTTTTSSRDSTASHSSDSSSTDLLPHHDCDSSRPSSVADEEFKRLTSTTTNLNPFNFHSRKSSKYFSLPKFSSVFRKEHKNPPSPALSGATTVKRASSNAKDIIRKYLKKVKPLYEKLSQKQHQHQQKMSPPPPPIPCRPPAQPPPPPSSKIPKPTSAMMKDKDQESTSHLNYPPQNTSFSGNLIYPRRRRSPISSCPSSIGSSPSHGRNGFGFSKMVRAGSGMCHSDDSSMEELQIAIQNAIVHCKNSMLQNKNTIR